MPSAAARAAAQTLHLLPRKRLSRALGRLAALPLGASTGGRMAMRRAIDAYVAAYGVDLSEVDLPEGGFGTFDEFFTRRLRPGSRPLEGSEGVIVSPADGRLEDAGEIRADARFEVKGHGYCLFELLAQEHDGEAMAAALAGGFFAIVYLSPRDYHRVHAPTAGRVEWARHVGGTLFPVNRFGLAHVPGLFARNERVVVSQTSPLHGEVITIMVGAIGVGRIRMGFDPGVVTNDGRSPSMRRYGASGPVLQRGDELGVFHLGSTAIVLWGPSGPPLRTGAPGVELGSPIRMGRALSAEAA